MTDRISTLRLNLLRFLYLITFIGLAPSTWSVLIDPGETWDPMIGIAYSFWGAYALLMGLGLFRPIKMLPLVLLQLMYKTTWLLAVGLPLWLSGNMDATARELVTVCAIGAGLDLVIIPWRYVFNTYIWRRRPSASPANQPA